MNSAELNSQAASPFASIERMVGFRHQIRDLVFFPRLSAKSPLAGNHRSRLRGRGMDFDEVRPYQAGDDIRTIDWRITARTTVPHTKLFHEERERPILIVCDLRSSMFFGSQGMKSVSACDIAAVLSWAGLSANDRVGGMIFSPLGQTDIRSKRSHHTVLRIIHALEEASRAIQVTATEEPSLAEITLDLRRVATPGSSVFLVSDFHDLDKDCESSLFQISRHCDLTLLQVHDELEARLPPPGQYSIFDGLKRTRLNTANQNFRQEYEARFRRKNQQLKKLSDQLQLPLISFKTGQPVLTTLRQAYGSNRRRKSA